MVGVLLAAAATGGAMADERHATLRVSAFVLPTCRAGSDAARKAAAPIGCASAETVIAAPARPAGEAGPPLGRENIRLIAIEY